MDGMSWYEPVRMILQLRRGVDMQVHNHVVAKGYWRFDYRGILKTKGCSGEPYL